MPLVGFDGSLIYVTLPSPKSQGIDMHFDMLIIFISFFPSISTVNPQIPQKILSMNKPPC